MSKKEKPESQNPLDFTYGDNVKIEMEGRYLEEGIRVTNDIIEQERKVFFPEQRVYVKDGEEVDVNTEGARLAPDAYATVAQSEAVTYYTKLGRLALRFHLLLLEVHAKNVEAGKAITKEEAVKQSKMAPVK
jgi:hypothetical protein